jgi:hypothetical protein
VWELLELVHEEAATRGGTKARRAACSSASILLVKTLVAVDVECLGRIAEMYAATMVRWVKDPKLGIDNSFFSDFVGWAGSVRGKLGEVEAEVEVAKKGKGGKRKRKRDEGDDEEEEETVPVETKTNGGGKSKKKRRRKGKGGKN